MRTGGTRTLIAVGAVFAALALAPAAQAIPTIATNGGSIKLTVKCKAASTPYGGSQSTYSSSCKGNLTLTIDSGLLAGTAAKTTIGKGKFSLGGNASGKSKVKLNSKARAALQANGTVTAKVKLKKTGGNGTPSAAKKVRLKLLQATAPGFTG